MGCRSKGIAVCPAADYRFGPTISSLVIVDCPAVPPSNSLPPVLQARWIDLSMYEVHGMKRVFLRLFGVATATVIATALLGAQAITNVVPTISGLDITVGGGSTGTVTISGSGFLTTPKGTRFVDAAGN